MGYSAQQWPEQIRVLLAAIPNFNAKKETPNEQVSVHFTINALAIAIFTFAFASMAQAQATRTWVSGVGDDANPCSRTAPCKTFAGAISKTAIDGEIDALDPGGFGAVTITKSITIDGGPTGEASILASLVTGVIINITATSGSNTVELRNLSINGAGTGTNGIRILSSVAGAAVFVEKCVIFGFRAGAIGAGGGTVDLNNVQSIKNGSSGIVVSGGVVNAGRLMVARNCVATKNTGAGFVAENGAKLDIIDSLTAYNATGVESDAANTEVRVSRTTITRNTANGLVLGGGTILSYGTNEISANAGNETFTGGGPTLK